MFVLASGSVIEILEGVRSAIIGSKLAGFSAIAATIAGLIAGVSLLKMAHDYVAGQGLTFWELVRPFVMLMLVANFNTFVASPLHRVAIIGTNGMSNLVESSEKNFYNQLGTTLRSTFSNSAAAAGDAIGNAIGNMDGGNESGDSWWDSVKGFLSKGGKTVLSGLTTAATAAMSWVFDFFKLFIGAILSPITGAACAVAIKAGVPINPSDIFLYPLTSILSLLAVFALELYTLGLYCQCYIFLTLLCLLGPFSFALSILPAYRQQASSWIARYINILLWVPISKIVIFVGYFILKEIAGLEAGMGAGESWVLLVCIFVVIKSLKSIPTIASYIVESAGSGGAEGSNPATGLAAAGARAGARAVFGR